MKAGLVGSDTLPREETNEEDMDEENMDEVVSNKKLKKPTKPKSTEYSVVRYVDRIVMYKLPKIQMMMSIL